MQKLFKAGCVINLLRNYIETKRNLRGNLNDLNPLFALFQNPQDNAHNVRLTFSIRDFNKKDILCFRIYLKPFFTVMSHAKALAPTREEGTSDL